MSCNGPIFVVGVPQSGTTLLRDLLHRHPRLAVCRQTGFRHYVYRRSRAFGPLSDGRNCERVVFLRKATVIRRCSLRFFAFTCGRTAGSGGEIKRRIAAIWYRRANCAEHTREESAATRYHEQVLRMSRQSS